MAQSTEEKIKELFTKKLSLPQKMSLYKGLGVILFDEISKKREDLADQIDSLKEFQGTINSLKTT